MEDLTKQNLSAKLENSFLGILRIVILVVLSISIIGSLIFGYMGLSNLNATTAKYEYKDPNIKELVNEIKKSLTDNLITAIKEPNKFTKMGVKPPKGALLYGPPGCGKTLLARAIAGEAGVPFFTISGSDFVEMFVGVGASRVRDMFEQGKKHSPCIIFIDEIDAVGRSRGAGLGGGNDEREQTLNQLLVEMDGFDTNEGVIIIAATNRPDVLDPALLRPGRFDKIIQIPLPDKESRKSILKLNAEKIPTITESNDPKHIDFEKLSEMTDGLSGADTASIANTAVSLVIHEYLDSHPDVKDIEKTTIDAKVAMKHFEEAVKKVREQKDLKLGEKLVASYYR